MKFFKFIGVPVRLLSFFIILNLIACGGSSPPPPSPPANATINSINISPYQIDIANTSSFQLVAVAYYSDDTSRIVTDEVSWSLQNNIANISNSGLITATSLGTSTITATLDSVSSFAQLNVTAVTLSSINIDPDSNSIAEGTNLALHANGIYDDLSSQDLTTQVTWQSSNTDIATINADGILTAQNAGDVIVTATLGSVNNTTAIAITAATLDSINVTPGDISIANGTSTNLQATGFYSDSSSQNLTSQVSWQSNDPDIAEINSSGSLTSKNTGNTIVTASLNGQTSSTSITVTSAILSSINITPGQTSIANGTSSSLLATGLYTDQTTQDLTQQVSWRSNNNAISDIDFNGVVSGNSVGTSIITASLGTISNTASVDITTATLISINVTPNVTSIANGTNTSLIASGFYTDDSTQDLTQQVSWQSDDSNILEVSSSGVVTARSVGSATITASFEGQSNSSSITVTTATLESITVSPNSSSLPNGTNINLQATGFYSDSTSQDLTAQVSWQSNDSAIAETSSLGLVTARSVGSATITASFEGQSNSSSITVTTATLESITVSPNSSSLPNGTNINLQATGFYSDSTSQDLTAQVSWQSNDSAIAETSSLGLVTARSIGSATITANFNGKSSSSSITITDATIDSITVSPNTSSLPNGTNINLQATGFYSDSSSKDLTTQVSWQSSNNTIAEISNLGLLTARSVGTAVITTNFEGQSNSASITVTAATLDSITVSPNTSSLPNGTNINLQATGFYSDASSQDLTTQVSWQSGNNAIAEISNLGLLTARSIGVATITASFDGKNSSSSITITDATIDSITVSPNTSSLPNGTNINLQATGFYSDASSKDLTAQVSWQSGDNAIAEISNLGLLTARSIGSATITASFDGQSSTALITITPATLNSININPGNLAIANGTSGSLLATGLYSDLTTQNLTQQVTWQSSDNSIAEINTDGLVTGYSTGTATITAHLNGLSSTTSVSVTTETLNSINISPNTSSFAAGTVTQLSAYGIYSDLSTQNLTTQVTWQSSNSSIAEIDQNGLVTGNTTGTVTITADFNGTSSTALIDITAANLSSIVISPDATSLANGTNLNLQAIGNYTGQPAQDLTSSVIWQSSDPTIAEVNSEGLVTSHKVGTVTISASKGTVTSSTTVTVSAASLTQINLAPANVSIALGTEYQFTVSGLYSDGTVQDLTQQVSWIFSNDTIAETVNNTSGLLLGTTIGTTSVAVSLNGITGIASLTVTDAVINTLEINSPSTSIALGTTLQLEAVAVYSNSSNQTVTEQALWQSSNPEVAAVSSTGEITSATQGTTTITSIYNNTSATLTINVSGAILSSIEITPLTQSIAAGTSQAFSATGIYTDTSFHDITDLVTWDSSNKTIASISNTPDSKGQLSSLLSGQTNISASLGTVSATNLLTVTNAVLTSIDITPNASEISNGFTQTYAAIAHYSDGSTNDVTDQAIWSTSNLSIANSNNSVIQSLQTGDVTVSANIGDVFGFASLSINSAVLQSISIDQLDVSIAKGTQFEFTVTGHYSDSSTQNLTNYVTWSSSSPLIATIQNTTNASGIAQGISEGQSLIRASYADISNSTNLTVTTATLTSISLQTIDTTLIAGIAQNIIATGTYSDTTTQDISNDVTWDSSDISIAAISNAIESKGEVIGYTPGSSTINALLNGVTSSDLILTITLDPNAAISISANAFPNVILNNDIDTATITATVKPAGTGGVIPSTPIDFIVTDNGSTTTTTVNTINGVATLDITSLTEGFITVETQIQSSTLTSSTNLRSTVNFSNVLSPALLFEPIYSNGSYLIGSRFGLYMRNLSNRDFNIYEFQVLHDGKDLFGSPTPGSVFDDGILSAGEFLWAVYVVDTDIVNAGVIGTRFFLTDRISGAAFGFGKNFAPPP